MLEPRTETIGAEIGRQMCGGGGKKGTNDSNWATRWQEENQPPPHGTKHQTSEQTDGMTRWHGRWDAFDLSIPFSVYVCVIVYINICPWLFTCLSNHIFVWYIYEQYVCYFVLLWLCVQFIIVSMFFKYSLTLFCHYCLFAKNCAFSVYFRQTMKNLGHSWTWVICSGTYQRSV